MKHTIIDASQLELNDKVVTIKRVTKTVKGGRNMRFTALVVVGDGNGHVGAGLGKAVEIPEAIRKGKEDAVKHIVEINLDENNSITHDFIGKYGSANVLLKKAPDGIRATGCRWLPTVPVSSLVVPLVSYVSLQVSRISVPSLLAPTISRTLFLQQSPV